MSGFGIRNLLRCNYVLNTCEKVDLGTHKIVTMSPCHHDKSGSLFFFDIFPFITNPIAYSWLNLKNIRVQWLSIVNYMVLAGFKRYRFF